MKNLGKWIAGIVGAVGIFAANIASAQTLTNPLSSSCNGSSGGQCLSTLLTNFIGFLFYYVATPLCAIMVMVGAFQMMTSAGDPEKFGKGKQTLAYAAIGFVVALAAGGVTSFIKSVFNIQ